MLDRVLRFFITLFLAIAGGALLDLASPVLTMYVGTEILKMEMGVVRITMGSLLCILFGAILGGIIGFLASPYFIRCLKRFSAWVELQLGKMPIHDVIAGAVGLAIGLILANLLGYSFAKIPVVGDYIPVIFSIVFGYLGITITIKKRRELTGLFDFVPRFMKDFAKMREMRAAPDAAPEESAKAAPTADAHAYKLLDTSVIIDGRIADICDTGFIEGTLLIPVFVLEELQHIADSADALKRTRGRRGLDMLNELRGTDVEVINMSIDYEDIPEVDAKLVQLAKDCNGFVVTNDFNLNKVASFQKVKTLNVNELAGAIKTVVLPGESMRVEVVARGKENDQGVGYLDDGTMVVVENGKHVIGKTVDTVVTSVIQTNAGRMIFVRLA